MTKRGAASQRRFGGKWFKREFEERRTEKSANAAAKKKRAQGYFVRVTFTERTLSRDVWHIWARKK